MGRQQLKKRVLKRGLGEKKKDGRREDEKNEGTGERRLKQKDPARERQKKKAKKEGLFFILSLPNIYI